MIEIFRDIPETSCHGHWKNLGRTTPLLGLLIIEVPDLLKTGVILDVLDLLDYENIMIFY